MSNAAGHTHDHGHDHAVGHDGRAQNQRRVLRTFWLIAIFMVVEAAGGWWSGSLTLIADAGHMLTDAGALALAWFAARAMQRPSDATRSYGYDRFSVLAALINGLALFAIVVWIAVEAIRRAVAPEEIRAIPMLAIAVTGLAVNSAAFFTLHGADRDDLNIHAAILHVLGDILASLAAVVAALVILVAPQFTIADPILSVVAGGLILRTAYALVRRSWHVLMEATPEGVNVDEIADALGSLDGVTDVHHLHVWSLVPGKPLITLHAQVVPGYSSDAALAAIKAMLVTRFNITHSTIQIESACADNEHHRPRALDGGGGDTHTHGHKMAASR